MSQHRVGIVCLDVDFAVESRLLTRKTTDGCTINNGVGEREKKRETTDDLMALSKDEPGRSGRIAGDIEKR